MSVFIMVIVMGIIWSLIGGVKTARDTANKGNKLGLPEELRKMFTQEEVTPKEPKPVILESEIKSKPVPVIQETNISNEKIERIEATHNKSEKPYSYQKKKIQKLESSSLKLNKKKIAQAFLLSEILDKPVALRHPRQLPRDRH